MKKYRWLVILAIVVIASLTTLGVIVASQKSELEKLPALMDASGKIELKVGDFKLEKQPLLGDPNAPVKVIEFVDFKCPSCKAWEEANFAILNEEYIKTGKVQFYMINFPFLGPDSIEAGVAAESIFKQSPDKYWDFMQKLFQNQGQEKTIWATEKFLLNFVHDNIDDIDYDQFKKDLQNHTYLFEVKEDFKIAAANGVYGTPSFIVNGVKTDVDQLEAAIQSELN
ncbi:MULTISPECIES: thioredoxin domain-containing protein [unclassified Paenibacillus]|uniref:DsbA family protein n=1 Tax=unclassified Paenibacillus TaxID=185978 RepID=UPI002404F9D0|nr:MULTISPECIES: thioredoxin domain-containing protein [unclassified Paenibacillus]